MIADFVIEFFTTAILTVLILNMLNQVVVSLWDIDVIGILCRKIKKFLGEKTDEEE